jgi:hypothetical protein
LIPSLASSINLELKLPIQANPTQTLTPSSLQFLLVRFKLFLARSVSLITTSTLTRKKLKLRKSMLLSQSLSLLLKPLLPQLSNITLK